MEVETIVHRIKNGDTEAVGFAYKQLYKSALRAACIITNDAGMAEDAVHQAFLNLQNKIHQLRDPSKLEAWLCRSVSNIARDIVEEKLVKKMGNVNMNGIQRVRNAIYRLPVDRVPKGELVVEKDFIEGFMRFAGRTGADEVELEIEFYRRLGLDLVCIPAASPERDARYIRRLHEEGLFLFSLLDGAFQTVMKKRGFTDFCVSVARQPDQLGREFQSVTQKIISQIEQAVQAGLHGIMIADDMAYGRGTYVSPAFIGTYLLPCWRDQVNAAKKLKVPVFFHSDGNINAVLPLITEAGFDGIQCLDPAAGMDIKEVKEKYGQNLCLMGNIDPALLSRESQLSSPSSYPELAGAVEDLMLAAGPGGGFIFGTSCGLHAGLAPEKVLFMYELANRL
ncbi:MAG: hypothetical protein K6T65_08265 [Peptococcaceae bacterium]|nr:hypothetical protein [Peptococcaceae bacterium]